jgi:hypothetical protein
MIVVKRVECVLHYFQLLQNILIFSCYSLQLSQLIFLFGNQISSIRHAILSDHLGNVTALGKDIGWTSAATIVIPEQTFKSVCESNTLTGNLLYVFVCL